VKLATARLELIAATPALLRAELESPDALARALGIATPAVWPAPLNSRETVEYTLRFLEGGPGREGWMSWYFVRREDRELVGQGGFAGGPSNGTVEVGYSLLERHQKRGYASEAVAALIQRAFSFPEVATVAAQTLPELKHSIRLLERLGFTLTGPGSEEGTIEFVLRRGG
jgi:RimJ/RimL family protein N-acetyltransferase